MEEALDLSSDRLLNNNNNGVDSACNRNKYQKYFPGAKTGPVCRADNLTNLMCRIVLTFWSLNILELSGPVQVCTGIDLYFLSSAKGQFRFSYTTVSLVFQIVSATDDL